MSKAPPQKQSLVWVTWKWEYHMNQNVGSACQNRLHGLTHCMPIRSCFSLALSASSLPSRSARSCSMLLTAVEAEPPLFCSRRCDFDSFLCLFLSLLSDCRCDFFDPLLTFPPLPPPLERCFLPCFRCRRLSSESEEESSEEEEEEEELPSELLDSDRSPRLRLRCSRWVVAPGASPAWEDNPAAPPRPTEAGAWAALTACLLEISGKAALWLAYQGCGGPRELRLQESTPQKRHHQPFWPRQLVPKTS